MQAIKNALRSDKHDEHSSSTHHDNTTATGTGVAHRDQELGRGDHHVGSTTGDSATHTGLRTGSTADGYNTSSTGTTGAVPTNASATRSTGLTGNATSSDVNTGAGRSTAGTSHLDHTTGHDHSVASKFDPTGNNVTHDHKHLNHVTHRDVRHQEVEEVERQREVDRHVHHVQHHVQPVVDKQVQDEVHHSNTVPVTNINEKHSSTAEDRSLFSGLASQHRDTETHRGKERTVVDLGEKVHENLHHHVHHVTQPVVEQEVVDRHRIHTVIPVHHTTHEAPIIHKSSTHEPVTMDSFLSGGGKLGSGITADKANVLNTGECERTVDGVGEKLAQDLHLGSSSSNYGSSGTSGMTGGQYVSNDGDRHRTAAGAKLDNLNDRNTGLDTTRGGFVSNDGDSRHTSAAATANDLSDRGTSNSSTYGSGASGEHRHATGSRVDSHAVDNTKQHISNDGDRHGSAVTKKIDDMTPSNNRVGSTNM